MYFFAFVSTKEGDFVLTIFDFRDYKYKLQHKKEAANAAPLKSSFFDHPEDLPLYLGRIHAPDHGKFVVDPPHGFCHSPLILGIELPAFSLQELLMGHDKFNESSYLGSGPGRQDLCKGILPLVAVFDPLHAGYRKALYELVRFLLRHDGLDLIRLGRIIQRYIYH